VDQRHDEHPFGIAAPEAADRLRVEESVDLFPRELVHGAARLAARRAAAAT
jgi:hypothetical protein